MRLHRKAQRGMTLIEMVFAMAIFAIFFTMMLTFISRLSEGAATEEMISDLDREADRVVFQLASVLRSARIPGDAPDDWVQDLENDPTTIKFFVPVDADGDGDDLDPNLDVEWGAIREDLNSGQYLDAAGDRYYTVYLFSQTGTYAETTRNLDLNRDGDATDTYRVGRLIKRYPACSLAAQRDFILTSDIVLLGDFDGDGTEDPLFELNGSRITIDLHVCRTDVQEPLVRRITTDVDMRNM